MDLSSFSDHAKILALTNLGGLDPRLFDRLFTLLGSLDAILQAESELIIEHTSLEPDQAEEICRADQNLEEAAVILKRLEEREIKVASIFDQNYPILLNELNDPPPLLFVRGKFPRSDKKSVALTGTSKAAHEGMEMTTRLAREFARASVQVVSGMSSGIAASAHLGARGADGLSFAIIDCGFDEMANTELRPLAIDLANHGGVISEHLPETSADSSSFHQSNRLIAGMAQAVVVTELYEDSESTLDLLEFCAQVGKLSFIMIDPEHGAFADETGLSRAVEYGTIPMEGYDHVSDIIRALV